MKQFYRPSSQPHPLVLLRAQRNGPNSFEQAHGYPADTRGAPSLKGACAPVYDRLGNARANGWKRHYSMETGFEGYLLENHD